MKAAAEMHIIIGIVLLTAAIIAALLLEPALARTRRDK